MKYVIGALLLVVAMQAGTAFAAKQKMVLMPISGTLLTADEKQQVADKLAAALSKKNEVVRGGEVNAYVEKVFREENRKKDCDADECFRKISKQYGAPVIAVFNIVKSGEGEYQLFLKYVNVAENSAVTSQKAVCKDCSTDKLAGMAAGLVE